MEIQDLLRMVVPFGILREQNGSSHSQNFNSVKWNQNNGERYVSSTIDAATE